MPPSQDPTSSTTDSASRLGWSDIQFRHIQPMLWIYGTGIALLLTGFLIARVSPLSSGAWSWSTVGFLLVALSMFIIFAIPGAWVATRHPWGIVFRLMIDRRAIHPRLIGLAEVWAGLIFSCGYGASLFVPTPLFSTRYWLLGAYLLASAIILVGGIPLLALYLFDRRR